MSQRQFTPGQTWSYTTRPGEEDSTITVLRVDTTPGGVIVHIAVDGVSLPNPLVPSDPTHSIGFMPLSEAALTESVTELLREEHNFRPGEDFADGYRRWKIGFAAGQAGFWTMPVAQVVQALENDLQGY